MNRAKHPTKPRRQFLGALIFAMAVSLGLYAYGVWRYNLSFEYLVLNLFLAAIPLGLALRLVFVLRHKLWSDWEPMIWTLAWLLFLPNSFYMISDFIHLRDVGSDTILFAVVLFTSFIYLGVLLGFCSLVLVHEQLRRRLRSLPAATLIGLILVGCSFGIYIGRDLRWNSWDVFFNPFGLLFDISDRLLRPDAYPTMFVTLISFSLLLASLYAVIWKAVRTILAFSSSARTRQYDS